MRVASDDAEALFDPTDGGRMVSFKVHGAELLVRPGTGAFDWGSFLVAPWAGRLRNGRLAFDGVEHQLPTNAGPHALHGLVTGRAWSVVGPGEMAVDLPSPWPWRGRVRQRIIVGRGRAEFVAELEVDEPMPATLGWHPWFRRVVDGAQGELVLDAEPALMWADGPDGVPSGELTAPAERPWDYCFRNLAKPPTLRWPGLVELVVDSDSDDWVLHERDAAGICVEPWSGPPNEPNLPHPTIAVPGHPLRVTMRWTWN